MSMPRHRLTAPVAGILALAGGLFIYGQTGSNQHAKGNPATPSSVKSSPPEGYDPSSSSSSSSGPSKDGKAHVAGGVSTEKKGKEAFQEAVKGTRSGKNGSDGTDLETQIDMRNPSKERAARHGN